MIRYCIIRLPGDHPDLEIIGDDRPTLSDAELVAEWTQGWGEPPNSIVPLEVRLVKDNAS